MLLAFVCSLVLEGPFAYYLSRGRVGAAINRKRFLSGHFMAQFATYSLLVGWYWLASDASLVRVPVETWPSPRMPPGWLYFDDTNGRCVRERLTGGQFQPCPSPRPLPKDFGFQVRSLDPSGRWTIFTGDYASGIFAHRVDGKSVDVALQTPSIAWQATYATLLPGGLVVYQLGDQIVLLGLEQTSIAPLARGAHPSIELD